MSPRRQRIRSQRFQRGLVALSLLGIVALVLAPRQLVPSVSATSAGIVISQVYGGGGNSGAPYLNDYVELFNRGNTTVSLTGWSVQYASATGTGNFANNPIASLSGSIPPGGYYLVKQGSGGATGAGLPAADTTGTVNMSATAGKIALVNTTTGLACNGGSTPCPAGELAKIVDLVGYGSANFFEGSAAPALSNTTADLRANFGCTETDNNSTDFAASAPEPRNSNDDLHICGGPSNPSGVGAASPSSLPPGNPTLLTVNVTPGTSPPSTGITVTGNLSSIGGSATQSFFDNASNGDVTAGDNIFSFQATVSVGTTGGIKSLPIAIADAEARSGSANISLTVQAPANPSITGAANPSTVAQGASVVLTGTVSPGLVPDSTGLLVTGDLSSIGGSPTQQFFDDGVTGGDTVAGNNVFTFTMTVPGATTVGAKSLLLSVTDAQARSGSGAISLNVTTPPAGHDPSDHMVMGNPSGAITDTAFPNNYLMMKLQYALSYNNSRRIPNWTSWHLDITWRGSAARQDDYRNDTTLPAGFPQVQGTDYQSSGFDRGHMCPSADRTSSVPDNSATFLMTNMVPQAPGNNQGPWADLENYLRTLLPNNELYIVSGGVGTGGTGSGGGTTNVLPSGVTVPATTWKVAMILPVGDNDLTRVDNNTRTIAVIMPNLHSIGSDQWQKYLATVDQVETLTGYNLYSNVDPAIQNAFEPKVDAANDTAPVTTGQTKTTNKNQSVAVTLTATDFNVNNVFTYTVVTPPAHGSLSGSGGNLSYAPSLNYVGPDNFTFNANDGALESNTSTVSITVSGPTATDGIVSGRITDPDGTPIAGAVVNLGGTQTRKTITDADGKYRFTGVQPLGFYTVTPSRANYSFSPAERSFSQQGNSTEAAFTGLLVGNAVNPLSTPEFFVRQHYLDFLGREPDESGLNFWSDQVRSCGSDVGCVERRTINVSAAYFLSVEFQETGGLVDSLYRTSYGRAPFFSEFIPDARTVGRDVVVGIGDWEGMLVRNKQAFIEAWIGRATFRAAYDHLSNDSFVAELISHTGVNFSPSERDELVSGLGNGSLSRSAVLTKIAEDQRFVSAKRNEMFVTMEYFGYLRRDPDASGYAFWLNKLNQFGGNFEQAEMVKAFINSGEYRARFPR